jgi:two-component system KDP operon response regulator KdpE
MNDSVLVIDDDDGLLTLLVLGLEREGFVVSTATDGKQGVAEAYRLRPDVILLDIRMPELDGWATCQRLRQVTDTPIIVFTGVSDSSSVVKGLQLGADDYVVKPCSFDELKARIRSVLRRSPETDGGRSGTVLTDGNLKINLVEQSVSRQGESVDLTPTEARLLMYLAKNEGRIVPHRELLTNVWGPRYAGETKYLGVYVRYLRCKIEDDPSQPRYITTKHRVGYCFTLQRRRTSGDGSS